MAFPTRLASKVLVGAQSYRFPPARWDHLILLTECEGECAYYLVLCPNFERVNPAKSDPENPPARSWGLLLQFHFCLVIKRQHVASSFVCDVWAGLDTGSHWFKVATLSY